MKYEVRVSHRAQRDLDRLDEPTQKRIVRRLEQLAEDPYDPRLSAPLSSHEGLRAAGGIYYQSEGYIVSSDLIGLLVRMSSCAAEQ